MVDGVEAVGGGLELRSFVPWPDLDWPLRDSTVCRSPRDGSYGANPLLSVDGWMMVNFFLIGSGEGFNRWRSQVLKLDLQLAKGQITVQLIIHPILEVGCVITATFDEAAICAWWTARCPSLCKWLHLLSPGSSNVLVELQWDGCSYITSTSSGIYHLLYLVEYMRYFSCCLVTMVVDKNLDDEICKTYYGVSEASLVINHKASLFLGEENLYECCLCCIWIKNGFEDVIQVSVKAFPFGSFHQWRVRSLLLLVPRFNGRHDPLLSSVMCTKNVQLSAFQPQVQKPIRSLGEPPGFYRRAHWLRPLTTAIVVARRSSRPIRHQAPLTVLPHSFSELLLELCICMLQSHVLATPFVGVPHLVNVL